MKMSDNRRRQTQSGERKGGNAVIALVVAGVVIIVLLVVVIVLLLNGNKANKDAEVNSDSKPAKREVVVNESNVEEVIEQLAEATRVPQGSYTVTQNYEWHFPKGDEASTDAHVENLPENTNDVYFDLFIDGDDETPIYQSPVIPRGAVLEGFKLDKKLDAGTYDCIMVYHLVDEDQNSISTVSMRLQVVVEG